MVGIKFKLPEELADLHYYNIIDGICVEDNYFLHKVLFDFFRRSSAILKRCIPP